MFHIGQQKGQWGVDLGWISGVPKAGLSLPGQGEENRTKKILWIKGGKKKQFNKAEVKDMHGSKEKAKINSPLPINRRCPSASQEAGLQYM